MKLFVHFAIGVVGGIILASASPFTVRRDFLLIFLSGAWSLVPDGHWMMEVVGADRLARIWDGFHDSVFANLFWLHHFVDQHEPARRMVALYVEAVSVGIMFAAVAGYYKFRSWPG